MNDYRPCLGTYIPSFNQKRKGQTGAIFLNSTIWPSGSTNNIFITFGTADGSDYSTDAAWSLVGASSIRDGASFNNPGMNLGFIDPPNTDFTFNNIIYSLELFKNETRNYGWLPNYSPGATIVHEFGHLLGLLHEHQNFLNGEPLVLNKENVINYYKSIVKNAYTDPEAAKVATEMANSNVLEYYDCSTDKCDYSGSNFDPDSIMLYKLADDWIISPSPNPTKYNGKLSATDKSWLSLKYPPTNSNGPTLIINFVDKYSDDIGLDWKQAWVMKTIYENFSGLNGNNKIVGINFIFNTSNGIIYSLENGSIKAIKKNNIIIGDGNGIGGFGSEGIGSTFGINNYILIIGAISLILLFSFLLNIYYSTKKRRT